MKTTFKTIVLGGEKPDLTGIYISSYAQELLDKVTYQKEKEKIELVIKTPKELGCTEEYPTTSQIFEKAKEQGLELCPAEVGPRLRKEYAGTDWLILAMEPVTDRDGRPSVFYLGEDGGELELDADGAHADDEWLSGCRFVFRHRKALKASDVSSDTLNLDALELRIQKLEQTLAAIKELL